MSEQIEIISTKEGTEVFTNKIIKDLPLSPWKAQLEFRRLDDNHISVLNRESDEAVYLRDSWQISMATGVRVIYQYNPYRKMFVPDIKAEEEKEFVFSEMRNRMLMRKHRVESLEFRFMQNNQGISEYDEFRIGHGIFENGLVDVINEERWVAVYGYYKFFERPHLSQSTLNIEVSKTGRFQELTLRVDHKDDEKILQARDWFKNELEEAKIDYSVS